MGAHNLKGLPAPKNQAQDEEAALLVCARVERFGYEIASLARRGDLRGVKDLLPTIAQTIQEAPAKSDPAPPSPESAREGTREEWIEKTRRLAEKVPDLLGAQPPDLNEALLWAFAVTSNLESLGAQV